MIKEFIKPQAWDRRNYPTWIAMVLFHWRNRFLLMNTKTKSVLHLVVFLLIVIKINQQKLNMNAVEYALLNNIL